MYISNDFDLNSRKDCDSQSQSKDTYLFSLLKSLSKKQKPTSPTKDELGFMVWSFLHASAQALDDPLDPNEKKAIKNIMESISYLFPCGQCQKHMQQYIKKHPLPDNSKLTAHDFQQYLCTFHNDVNRRLNKEMFDCTQLDKRWTNSKKCGELSCK